MTPAAPARTRWALYIGLLLSTWLAGPRWAHADGEPLAPSGLPGGLFVPSAFASEAPGALLVRGEYAHTESVLANQDHHERGRATFAGGYAVRRWLALSVELTARADRHGAPNDRGFATSTRVSTRHGFDLGPRWAVALAPSVQFPAAEDAGRGLRAASPELALVTSHAPSAKTSLSLALGYRHDRSRHAVPDPFALSAADRLAAELADYDALLLGVLATLNHRRVHWFAEGSWDVGVGSGAPSASQSPIRLSAGVQASLGSHFLLGGVVGASPSSRPAFTRLVRIEPRLWAGLTAGFVFGAKPRRREPATSRTVPPKKGARAQETEAEARLRVVDREGSPIAGARVSYELAGAARAVTTDQGARALVTGPAGARLTLRIEAEGFEPKTAELELGAASTEHELLLERALPPGEIKGRVRSLRGPALSARIEVLEMHEVVTSDASGRFRIDVPPGSYTLHISAEGHEPQQRSVEVEQNGVSILVIDLRRSGK